MANVNDGGVASAEAAEGGLRVTRADNDLLEEMKQQANLVAFFLNSWRDGIEIRKFTAIEIAEYLDAILLEANRLRELCSGIQDRFEDISAYGDNEEVAQAAE